MQTQSNNKSRTPVRFLAGVFCLLGVVILGTVSRLYYVFGFTASNQDQAQRWSNWFFDFTRGSEYIRSWPGMVMSGLMIALLLVGVLLLIWEIVRN